MEEAIQPTENSGEEIIKPSEPGTTTPEEHKENEVANPQPQNTTQIGEEDLVLLELEETLKSIPPEDVLKYQRELSVETGQNLFEGKIGEVFKKYKPSFKERQEKVKNVASLFKNNKKQEKTVKNNETTEEISNLKQENLKTKIELSLLKQGVPQEFLEEASIVALSKIKDISETQKLTEIANKFSSFSSSNNNKIEITKNSIEVGEKQKEMTAGEKAVAFLRKRNPNGFK